MPSHKEKIETAKKAAMEMMNTWKTWQRARDAKEKSRCIELYTKSYHNYRTLIEGCFRELYREEKEFAKHTAELSRFVRDINLPEQVREEYWNRLWSEFDNLTRRAA